MGVFNKTYCCICKEEIGLFCSSALSYNKLPVCCNCARKLDSKGIKNLNLTKYPLEDLRGLVGAIISKEILEEEEAAKLIKKVGNYIYFDEGKKTFAIPNKNFIGIVKNLDIYNYTDIIDFELVEDGNSLSKGGVGRAFIGGALFGPVGAIIGGNTGHKYRNTCTKLQIIITLNNMEKPLIKIDFIQSEVKKDSVFYSSVIRYAKESVAYLNIICSSNKRTTAISEINNVSQADEIIKFKQLLDDGIITEEQFEKKKSEILNASFK